MGLVGLWYVGPAVAGQVRHNERKMLRKGWRNAVPHHVGLRVAVQQQQWRPAAACACKDSPDGCIDPVRSKPGKEIGEARHNLLGTAIEGQNDGLLLPLYRAPADIAPAKSVRPADTVDCRIGTILGLAHGFSACADIENAPAIRESFAAFGPCAGMEDFHAFGLCRRRKAFDDGPLAVISGISFRR